MEKILFFIEREKMRNKEIIRLSYNVNEVVAYKQHAVDKQAKNRLERKGWCDRI